MALGGDITQNNGNGGESIYGDVFNDENFKIKHDRRGLVAMRNQWGEDSNGSQFFISFANNYWMDNQSMVFGEITEDSRPILDQIEA